MSTPEYQAVIREALPKCLIETDFPCGKKYRGKVRDTYELDNRLLLITTDRHSAFDRFLGTIPFKGQVLNQVSHWWFDKTRHIVPNHVVGMPDPNATLAKKCQVFPIEFVVRGYISGVTGTSLWTHYAKGIRNYCGNELPEGLIKNQALAAPILTPTTKETEHDRPITPEEIIADGFMSKEHWEQASKIALELFNFGSNVANKHGLILVDTKYEMGLDEQGVITLVDEIHTPDSSRYWLKETYEERFRQGQEPENIDKEFFRLWFSKHCDPYQDPVLPTPPEELVVTLSERYLTLYEKILNEQFAFPSANESVSTRLHRNLKHLIQ